MVECHSYMLGSNCDGVIHPSQMYMSLDVISTCWDVMAFFVCGVLSLVHVA